MLDSPDDVLSGLKILNDQFDSVVQEINKQKTFITCQFNVKPKYVLLGVKTADIIMRGIAYRKIGSFERSFLWSIQSCFDLIPIIDSSLPLKLPEEFVHVVIPLEVVGL